MYFISVMDTLIVPPESRGKELRSFRAPFEEHCQIWLSEDEA